MTAADASPPLPPALAGLAAELGVATDPPASRACRACPLRLPAEDLPARFAAAGVTATAHPLSPWSYALDAEQAQRLWESGLPRQGLCWLQSLPSQLPAFVLPVEPGMRVLDACAAPGGKAGLLAQRLGDGGRGLLAIDRAQVRYQRLRHALTAQGAASAVLRCADARALPAALRRPFDAILVDAPCSGSGLARASDADSFAALVEDYDGYVTSRARIQASLIDALAPLLAPGGHLCYATCSIDPRENEAVLSAALARHPGLEPVDLAAWRPRLRELRPGLGAWRGETFDARCALALRHHPSAEGEGFFVALLRKP